MFRPFIVCLGIAGSWLSAGCLQNRYELEMSIEEGRVHRRLTGSGSDGKALPEPEQERLATAYGHPISLAANGGVVVEGSFADALPDDIGGAGQFRQWTTSVGSLTYYSERFRGSDQLDAMLQDHLQALDDLIDLSVEWVRQETDDPRVAQQVAGDLEDEIRRDLRNMILLMWVYSATAQEPSGGPRDQELLARCLQYGVEHNYLTLDQLPALRQGGEQTVGVLKDVMAHRFGLADREQLLRTFPALANEEAFKASLGRLAAQSARFAEIARELQGADDPLSPKDVIEQLAARAIGFQMSGYDQLQVRFRSPRAPIATNGTWTEDGWLTWSASLEPRTGRPRQTLPSILFALWSEPDVDFQQHHFGQVVLDQQQLAEYVLWREALSESQGAQWDRLLEGLTPGDDIEASLENFQFDETGDAGQTCTACELIKAGLTSH